VTRARLVAALSLALAVGAPALVRAEPIVLRMASVAPDGTAWARELKAFGREVQQVTSNELSIKWYLSGIAGDELAQHQRVQRDQLDGIVSGGVLCQRLAPTMRAIAVASMFRDRHEADFVVNQLRPTINAEMLSSGYVMVGPAGMGFSVLFSRTPIRTMSDVRRFRPWLWSLDDTMRRQLEAMGLSIVQLPVEEAGRAYDDRRVDGFVALPSAAMAFQWSAQARYVTDLKVGYLTGCMILSRRAWDSLSHDEQQTMYSAVAKLRVRIEEVSDQTDHTLLGGLLARQGLTSITAPPALEAEFMDSARKTIPVLERVMPPGTMQRVRQLIAEYRQQVSGRR
jgi:TRAP-type C4-dicarboxylate transport system substrate-binding protein